MAFRPPPARRGARAEAHLTPVGAPQAPPRSARSTPRRRAGWTSALRRELRRAAFVARAQSLYWIAVVWRRMLLRTAVVAVTGTHGKTTTKELLAGLLAVQGPTRASSGNANSGFALTMAVLAIRPWHRFAVLEVGIGAPGEMRRLARLVRPDVAIVLALLRAHRHAFPDDASHAHEKALLLRGLRRGGVAILNADDARVAAMAAEAPGTVVRIGSSAACDVWFEGATARWPDRLELELRTREGESRRVRTRLVGTHWSTAVTAALAAARCLGVPLDAAVATLAGLEPYPGRMQPKPIACGATVLRDDYDGSIDAFEAAIAVLAEARATRRIAVISDASDFGTTPRGKRLALLGRQAGGAAELVVCLGEHAASLRAGALAAGLPPASVHVFAELPAAASFLRDALRDGDLVLVKGRVSDHLARLSFALDGGIRCWKAHCDKIMLCDDCAELGAAGSERPPNA